ncbi:MAG TPA: tetratricopeptide repeat protein, partial [Bacteroidetes bacterium]|nr:tetratricopeptide repeat protein [Bacteroidota bacterium]
MIFSVAKQLFAKVKTEELRFLPYLCGMAKAPELQQIALDKYEQGDIEGAIRDLSEVITAQPNNATALYNRAIIWAELDAHERARPDLDAAIALLPGNADLYHARAVSLRASQDFKGAVADLDQAITLLPHDPDNYLLRGNCKADLGNKSGA